MIGHTFLFSLFGVAALAAAATSAAAAAETTQTGTSVQAVEVASGLAYPTMFDVASDGTLVVAERFTGRVVAVDPTTGARSTVTTISDICGEADQGLFGVAVSDAWPTDDTLWAYATRSSRGGCSNQVLKIVGSRERVIHSEAYTGEHIGGKVALGADGLVYVSTGEGGSGANAQDLRSGKGKILRFTQDGKPAGAVARNSPVYAYGFRNVYGFDHDPFSGRLWAAENGPDCNDELNLVVAGGNYGWGPSATCAEPPGAPVNTNQDGPSPVLPAFWYSPSAGPTGLTFCDGCGLGTDVEGDLLYGAYNRYVTGDIWAVELSADRRSVLGRTSLLAPSPPPLAVESGPGGTVYYSDANGSLWRLELAPTG